MTGLRQTGVGDQALLPGYLPAVLKSLQQRHGKDFAVRYAAMLHEAARAMRSRGPRAGIIVADLGAIAAASTRGDIPEHASIGFRHTGNRLVAHIKEPPFDDLENLPVYAAGEQFRGQRVLLVNMSGASGAIEASVMGNLFTSKFGSATAGVASLRLGSKPLSGAAVAGQATWQITAGTQAKGDWRFPEKLLVAPDHAPVFLMNPPAYDSPLLKGDLARLIRHTQADIIIGVDPGGDSLYDPTSTEVSQPEAFLNYKQDHAVIRAFAELEKDIPGLQAMTLIPAPGMYGPDDSRAALEAGNAARLPLEDEDKLFMYRQHERLGLGKAFHSAAASMFQYALAGEFGLRSVHGRPIDKVLSEDWQTFNMVVPVMANVLIMKASDHDRIIHLASRGRA